MTAPINKIVEAVTADPDAFLDDGDDEAHTCAVMLLGHFRAAEAQADILQLFSLPDPFPEELFSDLVTEVFPTILNRTCNGNLKGIKALTANPDAYLYCRICIVEVRP